MMAPQLTTNQHFLRRDQYNLPILFNSYSKLAVLAVTPEELRWELEARGEADHALLGFLVAETKKHYEDAYFVELMIRHCLNNRDENVGTFLESIAVTRTTEARSVQEEIESLRGNALAARLEKRRLIKTFTVPLRNAASDFTGASIRSVVVRYPEPRGLLRVWTSQSFTEYDQHFGFRCSGWRDFCLAVSEAELLKRQKSFLVEEIRAHCAGKSTPSSWISTSNSASWMLKYIEKKWPVDDSSTRDVRIALINTAKLKRLRISFTRSDLLIRSFGGETFAHNTPSGVKFPWPEHYLVKFLIPTQCVDWVFSLSEFRASCGRRNVRQG